MANCHELEEVRYLWSFESGYSGQVFEYELFHVVYLSFDATLFELHDVLC